MDRIKAYSRIAEELGRLRRLPREDLIRQIRGSAIKTTEWDGAEPLMIETRVEWADSREQAIRIVATLNGPGWWRLERLEESVLVHLRAAEDGTESLADP